MPTLEPRNDARNDCCGSLAAKGHARSCHHWPSTEPWTAPVEKDCVYCGADAYIDGRLNEWECDFGHRFTVQADGAATPVVSPDEYDRIRSATAGVLKAMSNCPYCAYDEGHHDPDCVLSTLVDAVMEPHLDRLNDHGRFAPEKNDSLSVQGADMCPNCVTPWKCNGPHCPPGSGERPYDDGERLLPSEGMTAEMKS